MTAAAPVASGTVFVQAPSDPADVRPLDMSTNKVQVSNVVGPVNIQSRLDHVTQSVQQLQSWPDARKEELTKLLAELTASLKGVARLAA